MKPSLLSMAVALVLALAGLVAACGASEHGSVQPPEAVADLATSATQMLGSGTPEWAAYAPVTRGEVKRLLRDDPHDIWRGLKDAKELHLVVLKGHFDARGLTGVEPGPGPYLSLFVSRRGTSWSGSGYAVTSAAPRIEGRRLQRFDLPARANPAVWGVYTFISSFASLYLLPLLLFVAALLLWLLEGRSWPYPCGIGLVLAAAGMQIARSYLAARGVHDGAFIAVKMGVLALVLALDAAAVVVLVMGWRSAAGTGATTRVGSRRSLGIAALIGVAVLYLGIAPLLFTTGA